MQLAFHRLAAAEFRAARDWYAGNDRKVAERFKLAVDDAAGRIISDPDVHPLISGPFRWVRVRRFPFLLVFRRQSDDSVLVVAVAHAKRRPGYWRRRK